MKYILKTALWFVGTTVWLAAGAPLPSVAAGLPLAAAMAEDPPPAELAPDLRRQLVEYNANVAPGTVIVDTGKTYLYFVLGNGQAIRYGIGVGRDGFTWSGIEHVTRKAEWPDWTPPAEMLARQPYLARFTAGGEGNPLGARAIYLGNTVYRIHGTNMHPDVECGCDRSL